jgi:hypothetical protein
MVPLGRGPREGPIAAAPRLAPRRSEGTIVAVPILSHPPPCSPDRRPALTVWSSSAPSPREAPGDRAARATESPARGPPSECPNGRSPWKTTRSGFRRRRPWRDRAAAPGLHRPRPLGVPSGLNQRHLEIVTPDDPSRCRPRTGAAGRRIRQREPGGHLGDFSGGIEPDHRAGSHRPGREGMATSATMSSSRRPDTRRGRRRGVAPAAPERPRSICGLPGAALGDSPGGGPKLAPPLPGPHRGGPGFDAPSPGSRIAGRLRPCEPRAAPRRGRRPTQWVIWTTGSWDGGRPGTVAFRWP